MWSIGVITYILLSGVPPFNGATNEEILKSIRAAKLEFTAPAWKSLPESCKAFVRKLLEVDPEKRMSAQEALNHEWMKIVKTVELEKGFAKGTLDNLTNFSANAVLKIATLSFISSQLLSKEEKDDLTKVFKAFDKDGDGKLSKEELKNGYAGQGNIMTDQQIQTMFDLVDSDHSGFIDYSEFVVAAISSTALTTQSKLESSFKLFDKDGSGLISS